MARVRERRPGVYEITVYTGRRNPTTGRAEQISKTYHGTKSRPNQKDWPKDVQEAIAAVITETAQKRRVAGRRTLADLLDEYLRHQQARGRAPKTLLEDRRRADRIAADPIGSKDIRRLDGRDFDEFYARLAATGGRRGNGLHSTSRHHYHSLLRAALNQAIRWRWLAPPNPIGEAEAPRLAPEERLPPTPEEARQLALSITNQNVDLAALIFVDATTGMRRGEICGLRFCDINEDTGEAVIWWRCSDLPAAAAARVKIGGNVVKLFPEIGVVMLNATKNRKRRRLAIDPLTMAVLIEQRRRAEARCQDTFGRPLAPDAFIWSQEADHSQPWRPDRVSGAFTALRNKVGLSHVSLNSLRHFSTTQLLAAGIDPKNIAARQGHDASLLLRVYGHAIPARDQAAAQFLGELMGGPVG